MNAFPEQQVHGEDGLDALILAQRPGHTLDRIFYTDPAVFERDKRRLIARQWLFVDHESRIPAPGDYCLFEIAGESVILVRDRDGRIHALNNVCRHRGSRVCLDERGNTSKFICPYHAWNYALDGRLQVARRMPAGFERDANGLVNFPVRVLEGLIFVRLDQDEGADFEPIAEHMGKFFRLHGLSEARIGERRSYRVRGNWKLAVENYLECYHCLPAHPEYCRVEAKPARSSDGSPEGVRAFNEYYERWLKENSAREAVNASFTFTLPCDASLHRTQFHGGYRAPLKEGFDTASEDGRAVAPLMGEFTQYDGGETAVGIGAFCFMLASNDHAVLFRFTPIATLETEMVITWLVAGNAEAGRDFDLERLTWLWHRTTLQDKKLIENNQAGVESDWYRPGAYSELEADALHFSRWYLAMIGPPGALRMLRRENPGLYFRFAATGP